MKLKFKMISAAFLVAAMLPAVSGCSFVKDYFSISTSSSSRPETASSVSSPKKTKQKSLSLPYAYYSPINPFTTRSALNQEIGPLLYDCLAEPDENFKTVMRLASSVSVKGTTATVKIKKGVKFTDGTLMTSRDVAYSFQLARSKSSNFYSLVSNIGSVKTSGTYAVVFTLRQPDPLFSNMLYVPIVKSGTGKDAVPTGTGKYKYAKNGKDAVLKRNKSWYGDNASPVSTINLLNMPNESAVTQSFVIGTTGCLFTDEAASPEVNVNTDRIDLNLNRLLYLGVNTSSSALSDSHVRRAISLLISRKAIVSDIYSSHALGTDLPFNPVWNKTVAPSDAVLADDTDAAKKELALAGYTSENSNGVLEKSSGYGASAVPLKLTLLVNKNNSQRLSAALKIALQLKNAGIAVTVSSVDYSSYKAAVASGAFDLYLGEIKLPADMDLSAFFTKGSGISAGMPANSSFYSSYLSWKTGSLKLSALCAAFRSETPFIPVCYTSGSVSFHQDTFSGVTATCYDLFYNIEKWVN